jgi:hypothetical protein
MTGIVSSGERAGPARCGVSLYDTIGNGYAKRRQPDPAISAVVRAAPGDARRIVNIGAGAGSYEPPDITVAAVEPSSVMAAQRPDHLVPAVLAVAEELPFVHNALTGLSQS